MMPIGPLMIEHRLIERMIKQFQKELDTIRDSKPANLDFVDQAVDFIRTYADRCHHGKEEDILFRDMERKPLTDELRKIRDELVEEHKWARAMTGKLVTAKAKYLEGDIAALGELIKTGEELIGFYPVHIIKEDKHFFLPVMKYFSREEQDKMLEEFFQFDQRLIHEKYRKEVEDMERGAG
ncbi:MAG: cation-binding protein [Firmicutes bacterium]|nr:cation-binding protein [Bacillota bacterium]